jgi:hypothetical protein
MGSDRSGLRRLVDGLVEWLLNDAVALLRMLKTDYRGTVSVAAAIVDERCLRQRLERYGHPIG